MLGVSLVFVIAILGVTNADSEGASLYIPYRPNPRVEQGWIKATITAYGLGDPKHSRQCKERKACGFYFDPGYAAAISQNFFGAGPGKGAGPGCDHCWEVWAEQDSTGNVLAKTLSQVVRINDLCPARPGGTDFCDMPNRISPNKAGGYVHFDLCIQTNANIAVFGPYNIGMARGWARVTPCSNWQGRKIGHHWPGEEMFIPGAIPPDPNNIGGSFP